MQPKLREKIKENRPIRWVLIGIFGLIIIFLAIYCGGAIRHIIEGVVDNPRDIELRQFIMDMGPRGTLALIAAQAITIFFIVVPCLPVQVFSGYVYGVWFGSLISMVGVCIGCTMLFMIIKTLGNGADYLFRKNKTYQKLRATITNPNINMWMFAVLLFVLPILPYGLICCLVGTTRLRSWQFMIISFFAGLFDIVVNTAVGVGIGTNNIGVIIAGCVVVVGLIVAFAIFKDKIMGVIVHTSTKKSAEKDDSGD